MRADRLAYALSMHPDADVMIPSIEDITDFDFVVSVSYFPESDRFHLTTVAGEKRELRAVADKPGERRPAPLVEWVPPAVGYPIVPGGPMPRVTSMKYTMKTVRRKKP